jgi:hypothetical protein
VFVRTGGSTPSRKRSPHLPRLFQPPTFATTGTDKALLGSTFFTFHQQLCSASTPPRTLSSTTKRQQARSSSSAIGPGLDTTEGSIRSAAEPRHNHSRPSTPLRTASICDLSLYPCGRSDQEEFEWAARGELSSVEVWGTFFWADP